MDPQHLAVLIDVRLGNHDQVAPATSLSVTGRVILAAVICGGQGFFMFRAWQVRRKARNPSSRADASLLPQVTTSRWIKTLGVVLWTTYCGIVLAVVTVHALRKRRLRDRVCPLSSRTAEGPTDAYLQIPGIDWIAFWARKWRTGVRDPR